MVVSSIPKALPGGYRIEIEEVEDFIKDDGEPNQKEAANPL